ncbi:DNA oxidative demethylase ALKBH2 [Trichoplax sp. H2]|nr:DNA oxidative demethylase ALKBH2 [Trichoplax sp. H2]|eukprot:RDD36485.1 DNA oxidative demethylase ALKBH2 [Trichoplax sp. H2]
MDKFVVRVPSINRKRRNEDTTEGDNDVDILHGKRLCNIQWRKIIRPGLDLDFCKTFYSRAEADELLQRAEKEIIYNDSDRSVLQVHGKWYRIPRKQVAHGDPHLIYQFSGTSIQAKPWTPLLDSIRQRISTATGRHFNFVLINRYKDGNDHISEHRDNEKELQPRSSIVSLSLGQTRDFVLRHKSVRNRKLQALNTQIIDEKIVLPLPHGSLLSMNYPTNENWYHSLPVRKSALSVRINMTFRTIH